MFNFIYYYIKNITIKKVRSENELFTNTIKLHPLFFLMK